MNVMDADKVLKQSIIEMVPPTVHYISNFISKEEENYLLHKINNAPLPKWTQLSHRRLQNWGGIPHVKGMIAEDIPDWLQTQIDKVATLGVFENKAKPNHVLINEYLPGQGIMAHSDGPLFYPTVCTITCGSHTVLEFCKKPTTDNFESSKSEFKLLLEPRSLLILQKDLYHDYLHSISEQLEDIIFLEDIKNINLCSKKYEEQQVLKRDTRLSLTIRHVPKTTKVKLKFGK